MEDRRSPRPPGMTIRFSLEERQALEQMAWKRHLSMAWLVRHFVRVGTGLENTSKEPGDSL